MKPSLDLQSMCVHIIILVYSKVTITISFVLKREAINQMQEHFLSESANLILSIEQGVFE